MARAGLEKLKRKISGSRAELSADYKIRSLGLFGSRVRGEQKRGSDLDVLVEFDEPPSLFEFVELRDRLSRLFGIKVDLVMRDSLRPGIGRRIMQELVPL